LVEFRPVALNVTFTVVALELVPGVPGTSMTSVVSPPPVVKFASSSSSKYQTIETPKGERVPFNVAVSAFVLEPPLIEVGG
jgi:hypothetical protein